MTRKFTSGECLSTRNSHLFIEDCDTVALVEQFGSPLFVISEAQLRANVRQFQKAFSAHWSDGPVDVMPAIKANWSLATRMVLTEEGAGADVYSFGELHAALSAGVSPDIVSANGGGKSQELIEKCIAAGVRITVEDLDEPEMINAVAGRMGKKAKVRFRVKPNFPNLGMPTDFTPEKISTDMAIQAYKSGIPAQYLPELGKKVLAMDRVELVGFHFHGGRNHAGLSYWRGLMQEYARLIADLCMAWGGYQPSEIDIGGGFAIPRDPHSKLHLRQDVIETWLTWPLVMGLRLLGDKVRYKIMSKLVEILAKEPNQEMAPTIEQYGEAAAGEMSRQLKRLGVKTAGVRLQIEPGRAMYGNTGIHLARVKKFKQQTEPMKLNWVLTDTTVFFLSGGAFEYNLNDFVFANRTDDEPTQIADVVGHSCYADRILPLVRVPDVKPGDILAMLDMGAYQEVSASNFNALPRPAVLLVNGSQAEVIRRAETIEDVFRRDVIPKRLEERISSPGELQAANAKR